VVKLTLSRSRSRSLRVNRDSTGTALLGLPRRFAASNTIRSTHHPPPTRWLVISQSPASAHYQPHIQNAHVIARWTRRTRLASSFHTSLTPSLLLVLPQTLWEHATHLLIVMNSVPSSLMRTFAPPTNSQRLSVPRHCRATCTQHTYTPVWHASGATPLLPMRLLRVPAGALGTSSVSLPSSSPPQSHPGLQSQSYSSLTVAGSSFKTQAPRRCRTLTHPTRRIQLGPAHVRESAGE